MPSSLCYVTVEVPYSLMKHIQVNFEVHSVVRSGLTARQLSLKLRCSGLIPGDVMMLFFF